VTLGDICTYIGGTIRTKQWQWSNSLNRVARFSLVQYTKNGKKTPNDHKIYHVAKAYIHRITTKYSEWLWNMPKFSTPWSPKIYQNCDFWHENIPKLWFSAWKSTKIVIFGMKIYQNCDFRHENLPKLWFLVQKYTTWQHWFKIAHSPRYPPRAQPCAFASHTGWPDAFVKKSPKM
jgi:hypothetical protein